MTTRSSFTTTQAFQPASRTRGPTAPSSSSMWQIGTPVRATVPARGRSAMAPSVGSPAASQSSFPAV
jgi:hypothetical protein